MNKGFTQEPPVGFEPTTACLLEKSHRPLRGSFRLSLANTNTIEKAFTTPLIDRQKRDQMRTGQAWCVPVTRCPVDVFRYNR